MIAVAAHPAAGVRIFRSLLDFGLQKGSVAVLRKAFFDETGTHDDNFLMVAGFIATEDQWDSFNRAWFEAMGRDNEAASQFKAHDCKDPGLMKAACETVSAHTGSGFVISICPSEYRRVISPRFRSQHGAAYTVALREATAQVARWLDFGKMNEPVAYFFDAGHRNQNQAYEYFSKVYSRWPNEKRLLSRKCDQLSSGSGSLAQQ